MGVELYINKNGFSGHNEQSVDFDLFNPVVISEIKLGFSS